VRVARAPRIESVPVMAREEEPLEDEPVEQDEPVLNFSDILKSGTSVIEFEEDPETEDEPVIMDNGSIRSFNPEVFRVPTFVRKQMD
jgi:hypothetical protein